MIMRRFHNSMAVGFFMGSVVAMSQLFFLLFLVYLGYKVDEAEMGVSNHFQEIWMAMFAFIQSLLLGSFAAILAAHRSEILEKTSTAEDETVDKMSGAENDERTENE